ncbi:MAG: MBL fold metallo-hydrolase [Bacteroidota bacterium]
MIKFLPLGGADEIGASCFYLNISGTGILLDCGIDPKKEGVEGIPSFDLLTQLPLDFVFITHAHQDHIGSLPFLIQRFPHVIIYSTPQTKEIADITLHNAANILLEKQDLENGMKIYTHEEINLLVRSMRELEYDNLIFLKGLRHEGNEQIKILFKDAGHILGSAGILIEHAGNKIFYTGDINLSDQSIMVRADLKSVNKIDTLILETTYGSTDSTKLGTWEAELKRFTKSVNNILHKGGSVLIPVFALGKTQEMLASIYELIQKRMLTEAHIYTGGIGRDISKVYDTNRYLTRRKSSELELKEIPQINLLEIQDYNEFKKNPGIVLASSGMMLQGTTSFKLLNYWLQQEQFAIYGVGYMDPQTPGYRIMNSVKGDEIILTEFGQPQKVKCYIDRFYFPSHSKREDLLKIAAGVKPKRVILVHGETDAKSWVGQKILESSKRTKVNSAANGSWIYL